MLEQGGNSGVKLVSLLGTGLTGVALARARLDRGERQQSLASGLIQALKALRAYGIANWSAETALWARAAQHWPPLRIRRAFQAALAADRALKGTRISDERGVVTDLVLELGGTAGGREGGTRLPSPALRPARTAAGV